MYFWCGPYAKKVPFNMSPNFAKYVTPEGPNRKKTKMKSLWGAFIWTYRSLDTARRLRKRLIVWARMGWNRFESLCYSASRILLTWSNNFYQFSKLTTRLQCLPLHNTLPMKHTKWDVHLGSELMICRKLVFLSHTQPCICYEGTGTVALCCSDSDVKMIFFV